MGNYFTATSEFPVDAAAVDAAAADVTATIEPPAEAATNIESQADVADPVDAEPFIEVTKPAPESVTDAAPDNTKSTSAAPIDAQPAPIVPEYVSTAVAGSGAPTESEIKGLMMRMGWMMKEWARDPDSGAMILTFPFQSLHNGVRIVDLIVDPGKHMDWRDLRGLLPAARSEVYQAFYEACPSHTEHRMRVRRECDAAMRALAAFEARFARAEAPTTTNS